MSHATHFEERVLFSPDVPPAVNELLQNAVALSHTNKPEAEKLFQQAKRLDASCLQTYFALYKFYFYQGLLREAECEVLAALQEAAKQGGFLCDYHRLALQPDIDMYANETALFYLYSLKALAFIKLRQEQESDARAILLLMQKLDPEDRVGASVIQSLADALIEELS
ncbi:MAG: hypothetical protein PHC99_12975 [Methylococcales bacterium]|nr:hypothetical protein [Methylococcales bacterium]